MNDVDRPPFFFIIRNSLFIILFMDEETNNNFIDEKPLGLSEQIRAWRMSAHMSVEEVAKQIGIRPQIVLAFEEGDYSIFSARVYAIGYLKHMTDHFPIPGGNALIDALKIEWEAKWEKANHTVRALPHSRQKKWYITPRRLFSISGSVIFLFFAWFFAAQLEGFTGNPRLRINEPPISAITDMPLARIKGTTEKESQLTVNGREITMNGDGAFDEEIELTSGVNILYFFVTNRFGKSSDETRYVVVR